MLSRTKLSFVECCPSRTKQSFFECCLGQHWLKSRTLKLSAVSMTGLNSAQINFKSSWVQFGTTLSYAKSRGVQSRTKLAWSSGQNWFKLIAVHGSTDSSWVMFRTALIQAELSPGQHWFKLSLVQDSTDSNWGQSKTALIQTEGSPRQHWFKLSAVQDSTDSNWGQSRTALIQAELIPGQQNSSWVNSRTGKFELS